MSAVAEGTGRVLQELQFLNAFRKLQVVAFARSISELFSVRSRRSSFDPQDSWWTNAEQAALHNFGVVIALTLVLLELPSRTTAKLKLAISGCYFLSLESRNRSDMGGDGSRRGDSRRQLVAQLEQFRQENQELRVRLLRERSWIGKMPGCVRPSAGPESPWKLKLARVVGRDPATGGERSALTGGAEGVATNSAVFTPHGWSAGVRGRVHACPGGVAGDPDCECPSRFSSAKPCSTWA